MRKTVSLWLFLSLLPLAQGVLETGGINVRFGDGSTPGYTVLVSQAYFGVLPEMLASNNEEHVLMTPPNDNPLLCNNVTAPVASYSNSMIIVPRGVCTFEQKAFSAQQLGAKGLLVHGTLGSRYALNATRYAQDGDANFTKDDIVYPQAYYDYDCQKGQAWIPSSQISLDPLPYNSKHNDPLLSGSDSDSNLCKVHSDNSLATCPSQACLLTGNTTTTQQQQQNTMQACCAWDLAIWMYSDPRFGLGAIQIPAAYVTMAQGNQLLEALNNGKQVYITMYSRYRPDINSSFLLIWSLGVFVCALSAYMSANEYRGMIKHVLQKQHERLSGGNNNNNNTITTTMLNGDGTQVRSRSPDREETTTTASSSTNSSETTDLEEMQQSYQPKQSNEESLELNAYHAIGFIVMASSGLLVLFFFKIYGIVKILYGIGCSKAISQVIFLPLVKRVARRVGYRNVVIWDIQTEDIGEITVLDIVSHICGYTVGIIWIVICFTQRHPETNLYFWVVQDIMGASMCITFLETIKLNSIRVASILLLVAFFYDIFFVFITPLLFRGGESVMVTVATSGGPPKADASWCEKYPDDANCQGGDPLPMLLTVPRIGDYQGGSSLLGLGDIVLPGLLLSFAARYDTAKSLLGIINGGNGSIRSYSGCPEEQWLFCGVFSCKVCSGGYFLPLVIAYAVGLLMANGAVLIMQMGQPALLYLVPCCLGTMIFMGWRRKELKQLWDGPRVIRTADEMIHGASGGYSSSTRSHREEESLDNTGESVEVVPTTSAESASSDNRGDGGERVDAPLLSTT